MTANTSPQAPQLSSRLLRLALLWVIVLIASVIYTLFLSKQMEITADVMRRVADVRADLYQVGYELSTKEQPNNLTVDLQGVVWRVDQALNLAALDDESAYRVMARDDRIDSIMGHIDETWRQSVKPLLLRWNEAQRVSERDRHEILSNLDLLNNELDQWQTLTDEEVKRNIVVLRFTQIALGGLSILSVIVVMWFLFASVLRPLNQLQTGIDRLKASDWKTRVHAEGTQEFSEISSGFNELASHLDDVYTNLENKVEEKTASLAEKNAHLTALYALTAFLGEQHSLEELLESFGARVLTLTAAPALEIFFWNESNNRVISALRKGLNDEQALQDVKPVPSVFLKKFFSNPYPVKIDEASADQNSSMGFTQKVFYHIRYKQKNIGAFVVFYREKQTDNQELDVLMENLGRHLGATVENMRLAALDQQMAVGQERNILAQNLHDSIAQTLSFVNLQVQMLEAALKDKNQEQIDDGIKQIKAGVQECYDDVRELLLNFRTRVYQEDLTELVQTVLERFERQTHVKAHLTIQDDGPELTSAQKLQVIFILQEAISNVRKHAKASAVMVTIRNEEQFEMTIMDDGIGIDPLVLEERKQSHVGLSIMRERAQKVNARIEIDSEINQGTTVHLILPREGR